MKIKIHIYLILIPALVLCAVPVYAAAPQRIISLAPNITEILYDLGLERKIVGVTDFCDYPENARKKPKVGGMSNPSLEAVVSLRPDLVILTTDGNPAAFEARLRSLGIKTYVFRARKIAELPKGIRDLGKAVAVPVQANSLAGRMETFLARLETARLQCNGHNARDRASKATCPPGWKKKILFIVWPEPVMVAGSGTAINDVINLVGGFNPASVISNPYPRYSIEEILLHPPDVIFIGKGHMDMRKMSQDLLKKLSSVPAVRAGKVFFVSDGLYRLGPRIIQGAEELARCLH